MLNDHELIKRFQKGDAKAFDLLIKKHLNNIYGFLYKMTNNTELSEDLSQDVFLKLYKYLKNFRFDSKFSTYLYRINMNTANSFLKRNKWKKILHLDQIIEPNSIDGNIENDWRHKELWNAISKLPNKQRLVTTMRIAGSHSFKEISKAQNISINSAKVTFHIAIKTIKREISNES